MPDDIKPDGEQPKVTEGNDEGTLVGKAPDSKILDKGWVKDEKKPDAPKDEKKPEPELTPEQKAKAEADKKAIADAAANKVPEKYEFKLPEGVVLSEENAKVATEAFKSMELSQEKAQKLLDMHIQMTQKAQEAQMEVWKSTVKGWADQAKKEYGTELQAKLAGCSKAMTRVFGPQEAEFRQFADDTGIGNHPLFIKLLSYVNDKIADDTFKDGANDKGGSDKSVANKLYPNLS